MAQVRGTEIGDGNTKKTLTNTGSAADALARLKKLQNPPSPTPSYVTPDVRRIDPTRTPSRTTQTGITPYVLPKAQEPDPALDPYGQNNGVPYPTPATPAPPPAQTETPTSPVAAPVQAPAAPTPAPAPTYNGLSEDEYRTQLVNSVKAGVMSAWEANINLINNNLARALSELGAEQAALDPLYQGTLKKIQDRKFATTIQQTELMNQSGWNASNSGLAVGEHTRIANQASEETASADQAYNQQVADIMRRRTLTTTTAGNDATTAESQKNLALAEAEANATLQADERNRQIFENDRDFAEQARQWQAGYNLDAAQFQAQQNQYWQNRQDKIDSESAAGRSGPASPEYDDWEIDEITTRAFAEIMESDDPLGALKAMQQDDELPMVVKDNLFDLMGKNQNVNKATTASTGGITLNTTPVSKKPALK